MMKKINFIFLLFLTLYIQSGFAEPKIRIKMNPLFEGSKLNVMYFSNFDIFNKGTAKYIFDIEIYDITEPQYDNTLIEFEVRLDGQLIAYTRSDPFTLLRPANGTSWSAGNDVLINTQSFPGSGMIIEFNTSEFYPPDSDFEDEFYGSGKARRGQYTLEARITVNGVTEEAGLNITITNPSTIQLSGPGNRAGQGPPQEVPTEFPVFTFYSDGTEFMLYIYEKLAHHNSVEDVINSGNPIASISLDRTVLNYAGASGQPLQSGKTYFWFVDVLVYTTAGVETFRSEIFNFKVVDSQSTGEGTQALSSILEMLRPLIGNQVDSYRRTLSDFELTTIRINGRTVSEFELQQIIQNYQGKSIEISDIGIY